MKKYFSVFTVLVLCFCLAFSVGCMGGGSGNNEESSGTNSGTTNPNESVVVKPDPYAVSASNVFENGFYILADFETYGECIQAHCLNSLGRIDMVTDEEYVTRGKQAIKITIDGTENWAGHDNPYLSFITNGQYFQKVDFTDCDYLLIDIFNPTDKDIRMGFNINSFFAKEYFTLAPGANTVRIDLGELYEEKLALVTSFDFSFDRGELHEEKEVVCIDNFRAHKA